MSEEKRLSENENTTGCSGAVSCCPYFAAEIAIMNQLIRIGNLPPTKTFKATFIRIENIKKMVEELIELREIKKGINPTPSFATGGYNKLTYYG